MHMVASKNLWKNSDLGLFCNAWRLMVTRSYQTDFLTPNRLPHRAFNRYPQGVPQGVSGNNADTQRGKALAFIGNDDFLQITNRNPLLFEHTID